jgi:hypothetical protein
MGVLLTPSLAGADESLDTTVAVALSINTVFMWHDLIVDRSSKGAAVVEVATMSAEAAGIIALGVAGHDSGGAKAAGALISMSATPLLIHGIVVLARGADDGPAERHTRLAPTMVSDGRNLGAGLGIDGRF